MLETAAGGWRAYQGDIVREAGGRGFRGPPSVIDRRVAALASRVERRGHEHSGTAGDVQQPASFGDFAVKDDALNENWGPIQSRGRPVAEWLACWTQAQKGPGSNRNRHAVG